MMNTFTKYPKARAMMLYVFLLVPLLSTWHTGHAQLFKQNFSSSTSLSSYISATPTNGQFTDIRTTGSGTTVDIVNRGLEIRRTSDNLAYFVRNVDFVNNPSSLIIQFTFNASSNLSETNVGKFSIGSGFLNDGATTPNANEYASFGFYLTGVNNQYGIRNISTSTNSSTVFTGAQLITWVLNKSGSTLNYVAPDGSVQSVGFNRWDIWVGTTQVFNEQNVITASQPLTQFKFRTEPTSALMNYTLRFDNFYINTIGGSLSSGTYTLGPDGDFQSITNPGGLFNTLNNLNNVDAGGYTFQVAADLLEYGAHHLNQISGMSETNKIRIVPSGKIQRTISTSVNINMIRLNGADYVEFDGGIDDNTRYLVFISVEWSNGAFTFSNDATNNRINRCIVLGMGDNPSNGIVLFGSATTTGNSNNTIENCVLSTSNGTYKPLIAITSLSSGRGIDINNGAGVNRNNIIRNNIFTEFGGYNHYGTASAININTGSSNWTISDNTFYFSNSLQPSFQSGNKNFSVINVQDGTGYVINNNRIGAHPSTGARMTFLESAISSYRVKPIVINLKSQNRTASVTNNIISDITVNYSSSLTTSVDEEPFTGIEVISGAAEVSTNTIRNIVAVCNPTVSTLVRRIRGVKAISSAAVMINNNTISGLTISSNNSLTLNAAIVNGICLYHTSGTTTAQNNTISNISSSVGLIAGISNEGAGTAIINSNQIHTVTQSNSSNSAVLYGIGNTGTGPITISNNIINNLTSASTNTGSTTPAVSGICITAGNADISQNQINRLLCTNTENDNISTGITLSGATASITRNKIYDIRNVSSNKTTSSFSVGVTIGAGTYTLTNNMITLGLLPDGNTNNEEVFYYGIWNNAGTSNSSLRLYYNTVNIAGRYESNNKFYETFGFYRGAGVTSVMSIYNNVFHNARRFNQGGGNSAKAIHYAIGTESLLNWNNSEALCGSLSPNTNSPDYNYYFSINSINMGKWGSTSCNFDVWKANTNADLNSSYLQINPNNTATDVLDFVDRAIGDLHLSDSENRLSGLGIVMSFVPIDYDGKVRRIPSTVGAHDKVSRIISVAAPSTTTLEWANPLSWNPSRIPSFGDEVVISASSQGGVRLSSGTGYFYRLIINPNATLIANTGTTLQGSLLYDDSIGSMGELVNNGTLHANGSTIKNAGRFTSNTSSFNSLGGLVEMNNDLISTGNACYDAYLLELNRRSNISDIDGAASINIYNLTLLNNAFTSILNTSDPVIYTNHKTISVTNALDLGTGVFSIGGTTARNHTLAMGNSTSNGTITGTGMLSGSQLSNLHILGITGNVSTSPVTFTSGARLLNNLWIERQNAVDAITFGTGGVVVSGRLTLNRGHINTLFMPWSNSLPNDPNASLLTLDVNAIVTGGINGGSNNSYVNGPMAKIMNSIAHFSFPVGNIDMLGRIGITPTSADRTTFTARYYKQDPTLTSLGKNVQTFPTPDPANDLHHVSEREYWMLDRTAHTGITPANGRVRLHWTAYSLVYFWDPAEWAGLRVARHNGTLWENKGPGQNTASFSPNANPSSAGYAGHLSTDKSYEAGYVESDMVTNFSPFTFATTLQLRLNPLPVDLINLRAVVQDKQINVEWHTATETNSDYFIVEKSTDASNFTSIGKVTAAGISKTVRSYSFPDKHPHLGVNYYRLKQVDKDGSVKTSYIVSAEISSNNLNNKFDIYPNPSDGKYLTIQIPYEGEMIVNIYNAVGAEVEMQKVVANGRIAVLQPKTFLASGIYIVKVITAKGSYQQKIIVR